jgi:hypothetical protein
MDAVVLDVMQRLLTHWLYIMFVCAPVLSNLEKIYMMEDSFGLVLAS